jgi:long-chain fatty acid transport protein
MQKFINQVFLSLLITFLFTGQALAAGSGAYRLEVPDAAACGKGSAFVGEANNPSAVYYNPAGLTQMTGNAISMGGALIQPHTKYTSNAGAESQMQAHSFGIPSLFFVSDLGLQKVSFGIGATSSFGLGTEWNPDSFARYNATQSSVANKDYLLTAAYKVSDQFSVALGMDVDDSTVDKQKKLSQGLGADGNFRLKGDSMALGYRIAAMYKINDQHQFGLMYRSAIEHKYKGRVNADDLNTSTALDLNADGTPESNYNTVFGGSSYQTDVISKSTLPQSIVLGYSYKPDSKWTFNADLEWMDWSSTQNEILTYPNETNPDRLAVLQNNVPTSRDWNSVIAVALGTQYNVSDRFRVRTGYFYHQSPIPNATWEANLPDSDSHGVTLGTGYDIRRDLTLDLAWSGMIYEKRKINNAVAGGGISGTYEQWVNLLYATATYKF